MKIRMALIESAVNHRTANTMTKGKGKKQQKQWSAKHYTENIRLSSMKQFRSISGICSGTHVTNQVLSNMKEERRTE